MLLLSLFAKDMFDDYRAAVPGAGFEVVPDECPASVKSLGYVEKRSHLRFNVYDKTTSRPHALHIVYPPSL
jgi:hypothetical protein